ncbi:MAG TPA: hypothetical protein VHT04_20360, partial [Stellaceae bacterium]|nr:hypothetical protein [Stellaceae bacterium]
ALIEADEALRIDRLALGCRRLTAWLLGDRWRWLASGPRWRWRLGDGNGRLRWLGDGRWGRRFTAEKGARR